MHRTQHEGTRSVLGLVSTLALLALGCSAAPSPAPAPAEGGEDGRNVLAAALTQAGGELLSLERRPLSGDVVEYSAVVAVGARPAERIRLHRVVRELAPFTPCPSRAAILLLHGDFANFDNNFVLAPTSGAATADHALAVHLAARGIDVWGMDRRWTLLPAETSDFSSLRDQGFALALGDIRRALGVARLARSLGGAGAGRILLGGFSRGAQLAYAYASDETQRPAAERHVSGLVPLDVYYRLAPADEDVRQAACRRFADDQLQLAQGIYQADNTFFPFLAGLAQGAPAEPSPIFPGATNRQALLLLLSQTHLFFDATPWYHLAGGVFGDALPEALAYSPLDLVSEWFARAVPFQALAEIADGDALWCGEGALPVADHLADIRVPVFYLGAAGGFGELGRHTTTLLGSSDVTAHVVRRRAPGDEALDYGHGDLLYGDEAPALVWQPLADWILARTAL